MMRPRSYTFFATKSDLLRSKDDFFEKMSNVTKSLEASYGEARTSRFTLPAISLDNSEDFESDIALSANWYNKAIDHDIRWVNQPFVLSSRTAIDPYALEIIINVLSKYKKMFASLNITNPSDVPEGARAYAKICKSLSRNDPRGFTNFRFGVGFNITEYTPFFPFSQGSASGFSVALESLDFIKSGLERGGLVSEIESNMIETLKKATYIFSKVADEYSFPYHGADWSLAPLPNGTQSVSSLIDKFADAQLGVGGGFLTGVAKMTQCLKAPIRADVGIKAVGFNGVMLSVLEDDSLARSFSRRAVTVNDLLLFSTVCGCGLDMIPISGDSSEVSVVDYASDTASLAFKLDKPLGVRFMAVAKLRDGEQTSFSHDFVNNSSVIRL